MRGTLSVMGRVHPSIFGLCLALLVATDGAADQHDTRLGPLFRELVEATDPAEAARVEARIWEAWLVCPEEDAREPLARGLAAMDARDWPAALRAFDAVVDRAPDFAEGFNKRATVHFLEGDYGASVRDIERTLALEPRHFGALSGLAMIREAQQRPYEALEALERAARLNPHLPGLEARMARLTRALGDAI